MRARSAYNKEVDEAIGKETRKKTDERRREGKNAKDTNRIGKDGEGNVI